MSNIKPFKLKVDNQHDGDFIIATMLENGILIEPNNDNYFDFVIYNGGDTFYTLNDEGWWDKYNSIPTISFDDFLEIYL